MSSDDGEFNKFLDANYTKEMSEHIKGEFKILDTYHDEIGKRVINYGNKILEDSKRRLYRRCSSESEQKTEA